MHESGGKQVLQRIPPLPAIQHADADQAAAHASTCKHAPRWTPHLAANSMSSSQVAGGSVMLYRSNRSRLQVVHQGVIVSLSFLCLAERRPSGRLQSWWAVLLQAPLHLAHCTASSHRLSCSPPPHLQCKCDMTARLGASPTSTHRTHSTQPQTALPSLLCYEQPSTHATQSTAAKCTAQLLSCTTAGPLHL